MVLDKAIRKEESNMASFRVLFSDGSVAGKKKVVISVAGGGMASGITDGQGYLTIPTSGNSGKIIINGSTQWDGSLNIGEVRIQ